MSWKGRKKERMREKAEGGNYRIIVVMQQIMKPRAVRVRLRCPSEIRFGPRVYLCKCKEYFK